VYLHIILYVQQEEGYMFSRGNLAIRLYVMLTDMYCFFLMLHKCHRVLITLVTLFFKDLCLGKFESRKHLL